MQEYVIISLLHLPMAQEQEPQHDKEIPFKEAAQNADKAVTDMYANLANHARESAKKDPSITPEYVENLLQRQDADKAGRERLKTHLLEAMSREQKFTFEGKQPAAPEKEVPLAKGKPENPLRKLGETLAKPINKVRDVFKRG
jgi:hypothetical protein